MTHLTPASGLRAPQGDPYRWTVYGLLAMFALTLPATLAVVIPATPRPPAHPWAEVARTLRVDPAQIELGQLVYTGSCALCHGPEARGLPRLGKPLRNSAFVQEHTNEALFSLIATGRLPTDPLNTTGALMPARGNRGLTDGELRAVIVFLRALQDPSQPTASLDEWIVPIDPRTGQPEVSMAGIGHDLFIASCSACHGPSAEGMDGMGKPLATSSFVASKTDEELAAFVKSGRPVWDSANTTGVDMPPKGGNPALSDEQLAEIIKYIRSLHK